MGEAAPVLVSVVVCAAAWRGDAVLDACLHLILPWQTPSSSRSKVVGARGRHTLLFSTFLRGASVPAKTVLERRLFGELAVPSWPLTLAPRGCRLHLLRVVLVFPRRDVRLRRVTPTPSRGVKARVTSQRLGGVDDAPAAFVVCVPFPPRLQVDTSFVHLWRRRC